jgi:dienelactone hydrolase
MLMTLTAQAHTTGANVVYKEGAAELEGYLAKSTHAQSGKAILIVPDWKGISPFYEKKAKQLADDGYVALVADIYGKGVRPKTGEEAGALAGKYKGDRPLLRKRIEAALARLVAEKGVKPDQVVAIGYCFGGTTVLELARAGAAVQGVVSFHGGLATPTPADAKNIKAKVLALHGADDPNVPDAEVAGFEKEMRDAGVDWQLVKYSGAVHAFTNPDAGNDNSKGAAYNAKADKRSWRAMNDFFAEIYGK